MRTISELTTSFLQFYTDLLEEIESQTNPPVEPEVDSLIKEYSEAKLEPDFDGLRDERVKELQVRILDHLFKHDGFDLSCDGDGPDSSFHVDLGSRQD